jgi:hypothetical protein
MMRMIDGLTGAGFEGKAAGYQLSIRRIYRIEDGFFKRVGIDESSKSFTACGDGRSMGGGVGYDPNWELLSLKDAGQHDQEEQALDHMTGVCVCNSLN